MEFGSILTNVSICERSFAFEKSVKTLKRNITRKQSLLLTKSGLVRLNRYGPKSIH